MRTWSGLCIYVKAEASVKPILSLIPLLLMALSFKARAEEAPLVLSLEQRTFLSYALEAAHRPRAEQKIILDRAVVRLEQSLLQPAHNYQVKNFEQFLAIWKGSWPDTHSLSLDLALLEKTPARAIPHFQGSSAALEKKIVEYQTLQMRWLRERTGSDQVGLLMGGAPSMDRLAVEALRGDADQRAELYFRESDRLFTGLVTELDQVGERISRSPKLQNKDVAVRRLLVALFSGYFAGLDLDSKKQIMSSVLGSDLRADEMRFFEIMIQNSGPQMQKILQIVGRQNDLDKSMLEIFRRLESNVRPVPAVLVKELVDSEKRNYKFSGLDDKALGVGTMAQVHRAQLLNNGNKTPVVVRFLKPGIEARVDQDHRILTQVAAKLDQDPEFRSSGAPRLSPLIDDITRTVRAELDLYATIERQRLAADQYKGLSKFKNDEGKWSIEFSVPKVWEAPRDSKLMVQGLIKGTKLETFLENAGRDRETLKREVVEAVGRMWTQELFFGDGFFHADLHPGNFVVEDLGDRKIRLHLLDYGMAGQLNAEQRRWLITLGGGLELRRADLIAKAFYELSDRQRHALSLTDVEKIVAARLKAIEGKPLIEDSMGRWSADLMDAGLVMPYEFVNVNRGMVIIDKMLEDAGSKKSVALFSEDLAAKRPFGLTKTLRDGGFSFGDVVKLGWKQLFGPGDPSVIPVTPAKAPEAPPQMRRGPIGLKCSEVFQ